MVSVAPLPCLKKFLITLSSAPSNGEILTLVCIIICFLLLLSVKHLRDAKERLLGLMNLVYQKSYSTYIDSRLLDQNLKCKDILDKY